MIGKKPFKKSKQKDELKPEDLRNDESSIDEWLFLSHSKIKEMLKKIDDVN